MKPYRKFPFNRRLTLALAALGTCVASTAQAQFVREEILTVESMNVSIAEVLNGQKGTKMTLGGLLRLAKPGPNQPVVVIFHHAGGIGGARGTVDEWSNFLNEQGISTFVVDSYSPRGINSAADLGKFPPITRIPDAFAALDVLTKHPLVDSKKIIIMGQSHGTLAAIYSGLERFQKVYGSGQKFAAHISIYGICTVRVQGDEATTGPVLFLHGTADTWVSIEACREYAQRLKSAGKAAQMFEYEGADHLFDGPSVQRREFPAANISGWCNQQEANGALLNTATGKPLVPSDACFRKGASIGFNEPAMLKAHEHGLAFIKEVFSK
jgi:dienelactone hydrolase